MELDQSLHIGDLRCLNSQCVKLVWSKEDSSYNTSAEWRWKEASEDAVYTTGRATNVIYLLRCAYMFLKSLNRFLPLSKPYFHAKRHFKSRWLSFFFFFSGACIEAPVAMCYGNESSGRKCCATLVWRTMGKSNSDQTSLDTFPLLSHIITSLSALARSSVKFVPPTVWQRLNNLIIVIKVKVRLDWPIIDMHTRRRGVTVEQNKISPVYWEWEWGEGGIYKS